MNPVVLIASLAAVLLLAGLAHWLGLGGDARIDESGVHQLAVAQGFGVVEVAVDRAGLSAIVRDNTNRFMLIRRHGAHFVAEHIDHPRQARIDHGVLIVGRVTLDLGDRAGFWAANLLQQPS